MTQHATFLHSLVDLVEYAERHNLTEAALALSTAAEIIAPILQAGETATAQPDTTTKVVHLRAYVRSRGKP